MVITNARYHHSFPVISAVLSTSALTITRMSKIMPLTEIFVTGFLVIAIQLNM